MFYKKFTKGYKIVREKMQPKTTFVYINDPVVKTCGKQKSTQQAGF